MYLAANTASLNGHNFSSVCPKTSESLERGLSDDVNISHGLFPKIGNYGPFQNWDLSTPSERARSKLSENHNSVEHQNSSYRVDSSTFKMKAP